MGKTWKNWGNWWQKAGEIDETRGKHLAKYRKHVEETWEKRGRNIGNKTWKPWENTWKTMKLDGQYTSKDVGKRVEQ